MTYNYDNQEDDSQDAYLYSSYPGDRFDCPDTDGPDDYSDNYPWDDEEEELLPGAVVHFDSDHYDNRVVAVRTFKDQYNISLGYAYYLVLEVFPDRFNQAAPFIMFPMGGHTIGRQIANSGLEIYKDFTVEDGEYVYPNLEWLGRK